MKPVVLKDNLNEDLLIVTASFRVKGGEERVETGILKTFEAAKMFADYQKKEFGYQISDNGALNEKETKEIYLDNQFNGPLYYYYTESKYGVANLTINIKRAAIMDAPDSRVITKDQLQSVETLLSEVQKLNGLSSDNLDTAALQVKTILESLL
ncbi:hypothetical protein bcgnr5390_10320 [Bacillus luti]|nr:hypothetical protein BC2903_30590 [Bacillus cereus]